jgi:hypothetical protein
LRKSAKRAAAATVLVAAAAVAVPAGAASAATTGHHSLALGTSAASVPDGDYCGPTTQLIKGGAVYAKVCINLYEGYTFAYAYVSVENTGYWFAGENSIVYINSGGKYYNFADCIPPSHTVIQNFECSTALSQGSINGYVQGQIQLGINEGFYKAFSPSEPFQ